MTLATYGRLPALAQQWVKRVPDGGVNTLQCLETLREPQSWDELWRCVKQAQATAARHSGVALTLCASLLAAADTDPIDQ